ASTAKPISAAACTTIPLSRSQADGPCWSYVPGGEVVQLGEELLADPPHEPEARFRGRGINRDLVDRRRQDREPDPFVHALGASHVLRVGNEHDGPDTSTSQEAPQVERLSVCRRLLTSPPRRLGDDGLRRDTMAPGQVHSQADLLTLLTIVRRPRKHKEGRQSVMVEPDPVERRARRGAIQNPGRWW